MRKTFFVLVVLVLTSLFGQHQYAQNKDVKTKFYQKDFEKNKLDEDIYHLIKYKYSHSTDKKDTLVPSLFVDDREYKGLKNYGVQFNSKDFRVFETFENHRMWYLKVFFETTIFNPKDSIIEIEGYITGGWGDSTDKHSKKIGVKNRIDVFLGHKKDTIFNCYYSTTINKELINVTQNGVEVNENTIIDTFPAFYFKNYSHYKTASNGKRYFKIKGKVSVNTVLAFGDIGCYTEIFDLSTMIYKSKKNRRKKIIKRDLPAYKILIKDNIVLSDIQKEKTKTKETSYYTYTEEAENSILKRQYTKAKEQYNLLNKNYKVIFARDIHNAICCALFSRDYENAFYWAAQLAKKGVGINYFNSKTFILLKKQKQWNSFSLKYDSLYHHFQNSRNTKLKEELEKLVEEDQADYGLANRKDSKVLYETTERVTNKLIALLKEEGYPSEEKIGVYTKNDTVLNPFPEYHVLIRHAIQQNPKNIEALNDLLIKSALKLEHDNKRSSIEKFYNNSCFHIYKGNLYNSKSCGFNDLAVRKMKFIFNNPYGFFIYTENYIVTEYDKESPEAYDKYYNENFNYIMKISDNWEFYNK